MYYVFWLCIVVGVFCGIRQMNISQPLPPAPTNLLEYFFDTRY